MFVLSASLCKLTVAFPPYISDGGGTSCKHKELGKDTCKDWVIDDYVCDFGDRFSDAGVGPDFLLWFHVCMFTPKKLVGVQQWFCLSTHKLARLAQS